MRRAALSLLALAWAGIAAAEPDAAAIARVTQPPLGLPAVPVPETNRPTAERVALGRKLFFDRRLSHNETLSCAMCHVPEQGFTTNELAKAVGMEGRTIRRNSPTLLNVAYATSLFHDGREANLENQVLGPLLAANEMANPSIGHVLGKLAGLPDYRGLFERAYGGPGVEALGKALATYQRTLVSANAPFDRWRWGGEAEALSPAARRGFALFTGKAGCSGCHSLAEDHALFTDNGFHDTGIGWRASTAAGGDLRVELAPGVFGTVSGAAVRSVSGDMPNDVGRYEVTLDPADRWKYRTPSLRNVALTAPYMHDGSLATLAEVIDYYDRGGSPHELLDQRIRPLGLGPDEKQELAAFLESLTGDNIAALVEDARSVPIGNPRQ